MRLHKYWKLVLSLKKEEEGGNERYDCISFKAGPVQK